MSGPYPNFSSFRSPLESADRTLEIEFGNQVVAASDGAGRCLCRGVVNTRGPEGVVDFRDDLAHGSSESSSPRTAC